MNMEQPPNRGLLHEEIIPNKDGIFGSSHSFAGKTIVRTDGQWNVVEYERQFNESFDTFSCLSFGRNNQEEIYLFNRYGLVKNYSDRAMAKISDTQPNGNTPQKVYQARKNKGYLYENEWPWLPEIKTWAEYMIEIPQNLITLALGYAAEWRYWHDYVPTDPATLREALRYSPVGISVALMPDENGIYYKPAGWRDTHWAVLIGYYDNGDWKLFDTYPPFEKRIRADMIFEVGKIIEIDRQIIVESFWTKFLIQLRQIFN